MYSYIRIYKLEKKKKKKKQFTHTTFKAWLPLHMEVRPHKILPTCCNAFTEFIPLCAG